MWFQCSKAQAFCCQYGKDFIYARGVQDIKTLGVQYMEAIRGLKQTGFQQEESGQPPLPLYNLINSTYLGQLQSHKMQNLDSIAIKNFQDYLRIPSVHPDVDYEPCVNFLRQIAKDIGLDFDVCRDVPLKPHVILTWIGKQTQLSSVLLNSHMDVVPVFEEMWTYKPFGGEIDEHGNIYGRGAIDTKGLGIQYVEAVRRLKQSGYQPKRTLHVTFTSDEELGGHDGVEKFVKTNYFKKMNAGFVLDEGSLGADNKLLVFFEERIEYNQLYKYRAEQKERNLEIGYVSTVNLTMLRGDDHYGFTLTFDGRIPKSELTRFEKILEDTCAKVGAKVEVIHKDASSASTQLDDGNPFWVAMKAAAKKRNLELIPTVLFANSDERYFRAAGVPCVGFSPNQNVEMRAHAHDEYLSTKSFLEGIQVYVDFIPALCNV
ncbi:hypothetical protein FQR65_LT11038 [Abscondita terminalis]|nr:hypothetical protein FQR65_LT11038 [Abscondita terminalis]